MISGLQIIYRLSTLVRLTIDYRSGVDSFKLYWSAVEIGVYAEFADVSNVASRQPALRGKVVFNFFPSDIGMNNENRNYIKLAAIIGGVPGALEGPTVIFSRKEMKIPVEMNLISGYNNDLNKYIPVAVDKDGKIITS